MPVVRLSRTSWCEHLITSLKDFKALRDSVPAKVQQELYSLFSSDPAAARQKIVEMAAEKGVTLSVEEVQSFLQQMDADDEFDDVALDAVALVAIAGGFRQGRNGC